jgi:dTDP-4-amino-4,6-dideoxygalactose transaminase
MIPLGKACMGREEKMAVSRVFSKNIFTRGEETIKFEEEFAKHCGSKYAISTNSGTSALIAALKAYNIKGEVITVPNSFISTTSAILLAGAKPVFIDIEPETYNIDVEKIKERITKKTEAILPVHMYGHPCDLDSIIDLANEHNLTVIVDAAHALGAKYKNKKIGSILTSCFSFYPTKQMTVGGEGGIVTTDSEKIARKIETLIDHVKSKSDSIKYNFRMSEIQASIGRAQLKKLDRFIQRRRKIANLYSNLLNIPEVITPKEKPWAFNSYCYYVIRAKNRNKLKMLLGEKGIETKIHYFPIHLQHPFKKLGFKKGMFPVTEKISKEILSLPLFPELKENEVKYIVEKIKNFYSE